jgi:acyl-coenzyme A synthetase/AMP-(fatty) acid ligase
MQKRNFVQLVYNQAEHNPDKICMEDGTNFLTYCDLSHRIKQVGAELVNQGIKPGETVVISLTDDIDYPCVFLGSLLIGAVPIIISIDIAGDMLSELIKFSNARLIFAEDFQVEKFADFKIDTTYISKKQLKNIYQESNKCEMALIADNAPSWMALSSGSTGRPKLAVYGNKVFFEILNYCPAVYGMTKYSKILSTPKMSWQFGLMNSIILPLALGASAVVIPARPISKILFTYINRYQPTIVVSSPTVIKSLVSKVTKNYTLPDSIKHFHSGGEDLPRSIYDKFLKKFNIKICCGIGQLETWGIYCSQSKTNHEVGTVGKPLPGIEVKILDENQQLCQTNQTGNVYVKSPTNAMYYLHNKELSEKNFIDGWVNTGDCAYWNNNGNFVFAGRADDVFKINDLMISPVELESEIMMNPNVDQVTIVGVPNEKGIKEVHAFLIANKNFELEKFKTFLTDKLFPHQVPKYIHLVDSFPSTITNKTDRKNLVKYLYADKL